jgi:hypothetical protein
MKKEIAMTHANRRKLWNLALRQQVLLDDAQGTTLRVARGTLWITLERDTRDIVVADGDSFTIDRPGRTIVEAQDRATVWVETRPGLRTFARDAGRRIARWVRATVKAAASRKYAPYY